VKAGDAPGALTLRRPNFTVIYGPAANHLISKESNMSKALGDSTQGRFLSIDALRGVAALGVVYFHALGTFACDVGPFPHFDTDRPFF
jgi:hypothetical protein